jgi:hypothetical protein
LDSAIALSLDPATNKSGSSGYLVGSGADRGHRCGSRLRERSSACSENLVPCTSPTGSWHDRFADCVGDAVLQVVDDVLESPFEHAHHLNYAADSSRPVVPPTEVFLAGCS